MQEASAFKRIVEMTPIAVKHPWTLVQMDLRKFSELNDECEWILNIIDSTSHFP